jgi:AraC-like DNA-binding protein
LFDHTAPRDCAIVRNGIQETSKSRAGCDAGVRDGDGVIVDPRQSRPEPDPEVHTIPVAQKPRGTSDIRSGVCLDGPQDQPRAEPTALQHIAPPQKGPVITGNRWSADMPGDGPGVHVPDSGRLSGGQEKFVLTYIAENLHREVSLSELAGLVGLSRFHFSRSFRRTTGLAPYQFILASRVERAKAILSGSETSMAEISASLGFGSQTQFSAAIRKLTGLIPSQFRRTRR